MSEHITDAEIAWLREIIAAATPGKWHVEHEMCSDTFHRRCSIHARWPIPRSEDGAVGLKVVELSGAGTDRLVHDGAFIAAAREWLEKLVDEVERLRGLAATSICTWCGRVEQSSDSGARFDAMTDHILECVNHPVGKLARQLATVEAERDEALSEVDRLTLEAQNQVAAEIDSGAEIARLEAEVERLRGIKPELGPFPGEGEGLPRFGIRFNGPTSPLGVPMADGYWTPWHLAERIRAERDYWRDAHKTDAGDLTRVIAERDDARAEVERLKAEAAAWGGELENYREICKSVGRDTTTDRAVDDIDAAMCALLEVGIVETIDAGVRMIIAERDAAQAQVERLEALTRPTNDSFALAAKALPSCPSCQQNEDGESEVDPGCCAWCDQALERISQAIASHASAERAELLERIEALKDERDRFLSERDSFRVRYEASQEALTETLASAIECSSESAQHKDEADKLRAENDSLKAEMSRLVLASDEGKAKAVANERARCVALIDPETSPLAWKTCNAATCLMAGAHMIRAGLVAEKLRLPEEAPKTKRQSAKANSSESPNGSTEGANG